MHGRRGRPSGQSSPFPYPPVVQNLGDVPVLLIIRFVAGLPVSESFPSGASDESLRIRDRGWDASWARLGVGAKKWPSEP